MKLSDRLRPGVEAAPWVIEEVKKLEQELAATASHARADMSYGRFKDILKKHASCEVMYEDSEGRDILVIQPVDLFYFTSRLLEGQFRVTDDD